MIAAFEALLPCFLLIALGFALARTAPFAPHEWEGVEKLNYYVLFPMILLLTMLRADLSNAPVAPMAGAMMLTILIVAGLMLATRRFWAGPEDSGPTFSSHFQGAIRWQTAVALAVASDLFGVEGLALAAIGVAAMIPLLNVLSVVVVVANAGGERPNAGQVALEVAKNPLLLSVLAGGLLNLFGVSLYRPFVTAIDLLGTGALGVGLLLVGSGLKVGALAPRADVAAIAAVKLLLVPAIMLPLAIAFGVTGVALSVVAVASAVPTASSSYVLARRLGGDAPLMSVIITTQTLVGMLTLPFVLWLAGAV